MSTTTTSTPNDSPASIQPLHNPSNAAKVLPQGPLGNVANAPGMAAKALLAKKQKNHNPTYVSPTDNMMTPVTQKLNAARKKHFTKTKPVQLFASQKDDTQSSSDDEEQTPELIKTPATATETKMEVDDENPF
ncbi:hypothetical protein CVT24_001748 [Panaeolus cyanescens]|uniref:Uncharacterized protein n=1 Tax=Panaeolus cyanescens TaxID=181874 RepID=A0A409YU59_9AGAR|nr:hypothetical protein CVT24_001748 [Panaeolus cyanescens]